MKQGWTTGVLVAGVALLAACTTGSKAADPTTMTTPPSSTDMSTSTVSVTSTTTSPEEAASAHAEEVLRAYYRAQTSCFADPTQAPLTCFDRLAITTELMNMRNALAGAKQMQTKVSGDITLLSVRQKSVNLANNPSATPPVVPEVVFRVCTDVSAYNIVDQDGKSIVPADRKPHVLVDVSVLNYKYPDPTEWRVGLVTPVKDESC